MGHCSVVVLLPGRAVPWNRCAASIYSCGPFNPFGARGSGARFSPESSQSAAGNLPCWAADRAGLPYSSFRGGRSLVPCHDAAMMRGLLLVVAVPAKRAPLGGRHGARLRTYAQLGGAACLHRQYAGPRKRVYEELDRSVALPADDEHAAGVNIPK